MAGDERKRMYPDDGGLKEPVRAYEETFGAATVLKEMFFPNEALTDKEKEHIARRDRTPEFTWSIAEKLYDSFWARNGGNAPLFAKQADAIRSMWFNIAQDAIGLI